MPGAGYGFTYFSFFYYSSFLSVPSPSVGMLRVVVG